VNSQRAERLTRGGQRQSEGQRIADVSDVHTTAIATRGGRAESVSDVELLPEEMKDTMFESVW